MSSVLVEYPEGLPAPTTGEVRPTERRAISSVGQMRNTRAIQRDRHGTRTVAFTFTPEQAAIFREWWVEWLQLGSGWFAANWPLPWSRGPNVFRFTDPPQWQLIGGRLDGQGYWQVRATCEIRGRGMLPTAEVLYFTSTPYPIVAVDKIEFGVGATISSRVVIQELFLSNDSVDIGVVASVFARDTIRTMSDTDEVGIAITAHIAARVPGPSRLEIVDVLDIGVNLQVTARNPVISHKIADDKLDISIGVNIYASSE